MNKDMEKTHPKRHVYRVHYHQISRCYLLLTQELQTVSYVACIAYAAGEIICFHDDVADRVDEQEVLLLGESLIRVIYDA